LVLGSEGDGVSNLLLKRSDYVVKIPMSGHVNSLNVSVAAGIIIAHINATR
jgi:23S rRNA (guanosine2251-2'-O)-methyltransferase